jgi:hypothetical protein
MSEAAEAVANGPSAKNLQGFKYLNEVLPLLARLHDSGTASDKAHQRKFFFEHYVALLLLYFFNPILTSRNGVLAASQLDKVQHFTGGRPVSVGSFSEAPGVFDPHLLEGLITELAARVPEARLPEDWEGLKNLTAVDGSLLPALPRMVWALWKDQTHRAAKLHLHFEVLRGIPVRVTVTTGQGSERQQLRQTMQAGRLYVVDRGYVDYQLFQDIIDAKSDLVGRLQDNVVFEVIEERPLSAQAQAAGVIRDRIVKLGCVATQDRLKQHVRILEVRTGKYDSRGQAEVLLLVTSCLDLVAELVALAYKFRWSVELFFRWFKCILGGRHLLSESAAGVTIQVYVAIIANLLLVAWAGIKPNKRTFEMFCLFFAGWATADELLAHLQQRKKRDEQKGRKGDSS